MVIVFGVPCYLKWIREKKRRVWQAAVIEKTKGYAEFLKLKDDIEAKTKAGKK